MNSNELEALLQTLVGWQCWYAEFLSDGSLSLDFGDGQFLTGVSLWVAVGVPWEVCLPDSTTITNDHLRAEESLDWVEAVANAVVLDPETFGLFLLFDNGTSLHVSPSPDDGLRQGPSWRLATPGNVINVGPGTKWHASPGQQ